MRRNMGRRGGNNPGGAGPLMTGHLKDIDMELELLKRKREMIEQQQQLLVMEQQYKSSRHYDSYDQPRYNEPEQHGSNRDFSHLYDDGSKNRNQFGRKRQAEFQWQYEGSPKRTVPRKKSNPPQFYQHGPGNNGSANIRNQRPGPKPSPRRPAPLMDVKIKPSIGQRIANQKASKAPSKEFTPNKVFKPKASAAPNKSLGSATNDSASGDVSRMLLPDQVPTQQVSGRLELALGAIMKNIRKLVPDDSENASLLRAVHVQRIMKTAIRERIRTVMLGKVVGSLNEILVIYREEFPEETDMDIVNLALEAEGVPLQEQEKKPKINESVIVNETTKRSRSMYQLLDTTLREMFEKLEKIYTNKETTTDNESPENKNDKEKTEEENTDQFDKEYKRFLESKGLRSRELKCFLPRLMKKYIPYMIKCLNADESYQKAKAAIKANEMAASNGDVNAENTASALDTSNPKRPARNLPYFVKIMGRPALPKKKAMQIFLNQFNPKSIKKHRSIHNLLFVGFSEKTDFDNIVATDGTIIGRSTLSVRAGSNKPRDSTGVNNDSFVSDVNQEEAKDESKGSDLITDDLDCQITDLLSSIRKSEEESPPTAKGTDNTEDVSEQNENGEGQQDKNVKEDEKETEGTKKADNQDSAAETHSNKDTVVKLEDKNLQVAVEVEKQDAEKANGTVKAEKQESETANLQESIKADNNSEVVNNRNTQKDSEPLSESSENTTNPEEKIEDEKIGELKSSSGISTPLRMSSRLANVTPSTIRTRRASRLTQN